VRLYVSFRFCCRKQSDNYLLTIKYHFVPFCELHRKTKNCNDIQTTLLTLDVGPRDGTGSRVTGSKGTGRVTGQRFRPGYISVQSLDKEETTSIKTAAYANNIFVQKNFGHVYRNFAVHSAGCTGHGLRLRPYNTTALTCLCLCYIPHIYLPRQFSTEKLTDSVQRGRNDSQRRGQGIDTLLT